MRYDTVELGPTIMTRIEDFCLADCHDNQYQLSDLMGGQGMLLGFIGDIWHATSVRRILWLQHHVHKFALMGTPVALLVRDQPTTLYGFHMSSPLPVPFPVLADTDGAVHEAYRMERHPGLLLIDQDYYLRMKWLMPSDRVWPRVNEITQAVNEL